MRETYRWTMKNCGYGLDSRSFQGIYKCLVIAAIAISDPTWLTNLLVKMGARSFSLPGVISAYHLSLSPGAPLLKFKRQYKENWPIQRHGYKTPAPARREQFQTLPLAA